MFVRSGEPAMPNLGPEFLHRPLPGLPSDFLAKAAAWFGEELRFWIPRSLAEWGWTLAFTLVEINETDSDDKVTLVERSWLGARRASIASPQELVGPVKLCLPPEQVFLTEIDLPAAARATLKQTVSLRLEEISPIPPEEAAFDVVALEGDDTARVRAEIAITKKAYLTRAKQRFGATTLLAIGAEAQDNGRLRFIFEKPERRQSASIDAGYYKAAAMTAAILFLFFATDTRLNRALVAIDRHEQALIAELRDLKTNAALFADLPDQVAPSVAPAKIAALIRKGAEDLPKPAVIERVSMTSASLVIEGYAPSETIWPETAAVVLTGSEHPGFKRFQFELNGAEDQ